jgi:hypothetical protein
LREIDFCDLIITAARWMNVEGCSMISARLVCFHSALILLSGPLFAQGAHASLIVDLRAISGSGVTFASPKSVIVDQSSAGGVIDFEVWGVVRGTNSVISDEAFQTLAGSVLTTQFGNGGVSGSLMNSGEIAPGISRGVYSHFTGASTSNGKLQNLDGDPDLEIGGSVAADILVARRDPLLPRLRDTDGGALADFLIYRFSLPITSVLATNPLNDFTVVNFEQYRRTPFAALWFEDDKSKSPRASSLDGSGVWVHLAGLPEDRRFEAANEPVPEPAASALALLFFAVIAVYRRRLWAK